MCIEMGITGIPRVPWDSHGNGMEMGMNVTGMELACSQ